MLIYDNVFTDESELADLINSIMLSEDTQNIFEYLYDNGYIVDGDFLVSYNDDNYDSQSAYELAIDKFSNRFKEYNGIYIDFYKIIDEFGLEDEFYDWIFNICSENDNFSSFEYENFISNKFRYDF